MPLLHLQSINFWTHYAFITRNIHVHSLIPKVIEHFFFHFIACNSMIASSKQRQEHKNLATIQRAILKGAHEHYESL